ncbi:MAG TPA: hypothetical protein VJV78_04895 [Polyangiales bacterium]|nr:hypothetical protein [Polyangiales bacterium]
MRSTTLCLSLLVLGLWSTSAAAQIRSPGSHPRYGVELEPHLVIQWSNEPYWNDAGIGVGLRASIPLIQQGPVTTINNSLALGFGFDWAHFDCGPYDTCDSSDLWFPVVVQWNFFITPAISLFPELGLGIQYSWLDWDGRVPNDCVRIQGTNICDDDVDDVDVHLVFWFGARFQLSKDIALVLRLGIPSLLFGPSFFL